MIKLNLRNSAILTALSIPFVFNLTTPAHAVVKFSPHRAVYDLEMKSARERSGVKSINGRMVVEIDGSACDGWSINFRLVNDFALPLGKKRLIDIRSSSWEAGDGTKLTFSEREYIDNRPGPRTRLTAFQKDAKVVLKSPKKSSFKIPQGSIFPIAHQMRLIEKAKKGILRDKSTVYDGADHKNIHEAIAFIGQQKPTKNLTKDITGKGAAALLNNAQSWPVSVSYFALKSKSPKDVPDQQVSFRLFENGVTGDLVIDYGEFAIKGTLTHLEKLPVSKCNK